MKKRFVYFRYIFSTLSVVLTLAAGFIPNVSFTLGSELKKMRSAASLLAAAWQQCREYIVNEQAITTVPAIQSFSLWTMVGIAVTLAVAAAALGLSAWASAVALGIIRRPDCAAAAQNRMTLCRVLPNEWWMLAANCLIIIPALFPYYLSIMYTHVLHLNTGVRSGLTVIAVVLTVVSGIVTAVSSKFEKQMGIYPFDIK